MNWEPFYWLGLIVAGIFTLSLLFAFVCCVLGFFWTGKKKP